MVVTLLIAIAASAAALPQEHSAPTATTGELALATVASKPGDGLRVTSLVENHQTITFMVGGGKLREYEQSILDHAAFVATHTARADAAEVKLAYGACTSVSTNPAEENEQPLPVSRRTFLIAAKDVRALEQRNDTIAERPLTKDEHAALDERVVHDAAPLFAASSLAEFLAKQTLLAGKAVTIPAECAVALLGATFGEAQVQSCTLTPHAIPSNGASESLSVAFTVALAATMKPAAGKPGSELPVESSFELAGEVEFEKARGLLLRADLSGPIRYSGSMQQAGSKVEVTGSGTLSWRLHAEPFTE